MIVSSRECFVIYKVDGKLGNYELDEPFVISNLKSQPVSLFLVTFIANDEESHPIHCLRNVLATASVVPEPQKKSAIRSPGLENFPIILSSSALCFSVP